MVVGGPTFPNGMSVPSGWLVPPPVDPTGVAAAFDALHPDDKELAKLADHTGVAAVFDALHPDDKAAAAAASAPLALQPGLGIPSAALDQAQPIGLGPQRPTVADLTGRTSPGFEGLTVDAPAAAGGVAVPLPADSGALGGTSFLGAPVTAPGAPSVTPSSQEEKSPLSGYTAAQLTAMATSDDPKEQARFVALKTMDESWRADKQAADLAQVQKDRRWQVEQDLKNQQFANNEAQAKLKQRDDALTALSNQKIDPRRYWSSLGAGQKFANLLGAIAGGIAAGQVPGGNGQNLFLNDLNKQIEQDIDAQKANLENSRDVESSKRGLLAQSLALTGNMQQATAVAHQALYADALNQLTTAQQQYDPAGRRAMAIASNMAQLKANMIAQGQASFQRDFDNSIKATTAGTTVAKARADIAHQKAEERQAQQRIGIEGMTASSEVQARAAASKLAERKQDFSEVSAAAGGLNAQGDVNGTVGGKLVGLDPKTGRPAFDSFKNDDGTDWVPPTKDLKPIQDKVNAATEANALVNSMLRKIDEFGHGDSDTVKNGIWQAFKVEGARLKAVAHQEIGIKGFKSGVIELMNEMTTAGIDPTSFLHDASPALIKYRDSVNDSVDTAMRGAHYKGPPFQPPDTSKVYTPTKNEIDELAGRANTLGVSERHGVLSSIGSVGVGTTAQDLNTEQSEKDRETAFGQLEKLVGGEDPKARQQALGSLVDLASGTAGGAASGITPAIRERAQKIIDAKGYNWVNDIKSIDPSSYKAPAGLPAAQPDETPAKLAETVKARLRHDLASPDAAVRRRAAMEAVGLFGTGKKSKGSVPNSSPLEPSDEGEGDE